MFSGYSRLIFKFLAFLSLVFLILGTNIAVLSQQTNTNPINFNIPKVFKDGKDEVTKSNGVNVWRFEGELNLDDAIKYSWARTDLNIKYRDTPARGGGYLKIYKDDDTIPENFIIDYGSSPLQINKLSNKLIEGENKLIIQYIDNTKRVQSKYVFSFNFKNFTNAPSITVIQPSTASVFAKGIDQEFVLRLQNFSLENNDSNNKNRGKLNIYFGEVKAATNLLGTINISKDLGNGQSEVRFNSKDINFEKAKIPDNLATKFIFVLTKTNGELLPYQAETFAKTNYNNSLNIGLPKVVITEPRKDRTDLEVDGERTFLINTENFEVLSERTDGANETGKGYMQILIDDIPQKTVFSGNKFTLNEIVPNDLNSGRKTIKVQLVNKDFTKLSPEASDSIDIIYVSKTSADSTSNSPQVKSNDWRTSVVILTIVLVVGGIAILVTKG